MTWVKGVWTGSRNPDIDIILPGLERGSGRSKDRLKLSGSTNDEKLYNARKAMLQDLHGRLLMDPLRALYDKSVTIREVEAAYRQGEAGLGALIQGAKVKQLRTLVDQWLRSPDMKDAERAETQMERLLEFLGEGATTSDITAKRVNAFLGQLTTLSRGVGRVASGGTRNRYRATIQAFCSWCVREEHLATSPFFVRKAVTVYQELPPEHVRLPEMEPEEVVQYLGRVGELAGATYKLVQWAHIETGADTGELYEHLTVRMCKFAEGDGLNRLRFLRSKTRNRGAIERFVPVTDLFAQALRRHIAEQELGRDDLVFGMCNRWTAYGIHKEALKAVTKRNITVKGLRHVAAISWRWAGADLEQIRVWLGLTTLQQVQRYSAFKPRDDFDAPIIAAVAKARSQKAKVA